tara:strand:+ start:153 stop:542 length:390 start_codon:yes stop_codon:yes gene_type:complete
MITWIAVKAAWASFLGWCKERWELLVGVLVGVLGMLALRSSNKDMEKVLEEKNELNDKLASAESEARKKEDAALRANLEKYLQANEQAKKDLDKKVASLDKDKRSALDALLSSDTPEEEIAERLKEFLN